MALVNLLIQNQCQFLPSPGRPALALVQWAQLIEALGLHSCGWAGSRCGLARQMVCVCVCVGSRFLNTLLREKKLGLCRVNTAASHGETSL